MAGMEVLTMLRLPGLCVSEDLKVRIGSAEAALTPSAGFKVAEALLRGATRAAIAEEAAAASFRPATATRPRRTKVPT